MADAWHSARGYWLHGGACLDLFLASNGFHDRARGLHLDEGRLALHALICRRNLVQKVDLTLVLNRVRVLNFGERDLKVIKINVVYPRPVFVNLGCVLLSSTEALRVNLNKLVS